MSTALSPDFESPHPLPTLRQSVVSILQQNKQLTLTLLHSDIRIQLPLYDNELLKYPLPNLPPQTLQKKLSHILEVQTYHNEKLLRKTKSIQQENETRMFEKAQMVEENVREYGFLREQWAGYRVGGEGMELDDRVDRLNKVVASLRNQVARQVVRESREGFQLPQEAPWMRDKELKTLKQRLEASEMQKEEVFGKLHTLQTVYEKTKQQNESLVSEMKKTKDRLKALEIQFLATSKRQQEVNDRLSKLQSQLDKDKRKNKLTYLGTGFTLELSQEGLPKNDLTTTKSFQQIRDFLEQNKQNHDHTQTTLTIPKLNFQKRYSMVMTEPSEPCEEDDLGKGELLSSRQRRLKEVVNVKFARTSRLTARMSELQTSKRSFYTKLNRLEECRSQNSDNSSML